jgi:hypothetical protein
MAEQAEQAAQAATDRSVPADMQEESAVRAARVARAVQCMSEDFLVKVTAVS